MTVTPIGEEIRRRREALGWSRAELDARARVTARTVERIEVRGQQPSPDTIEALASAMGATAGELAGGASVGIEVAIGGLVARHGLDAVLMALAERV